MCRWYTLHTYISITYLENSIKRLWKIARDSCVFACCSMLHTSYDCFRLKWVKFKSSCMNLLQAPIFMPRLSVSAQKCRHSCVIPGLYPLKYPVASSVWTVNWVILLFKKEMMNSATTISTKRAYTLIVYLTCTFQQMNV